MRLKFATAKSDLFSASTSPKEDGPVRAEQFVTGPKEPVVGRNLLICALLWRADQPMLELGHPIGTLGIANDSQFAVEETIASPVPLAPMV